MTPALRQPDLNRAKAAAFKLSKRYGFLHPAQMTLEDIAWDRGVVIAPGSLDGSEARLVRKGKRGIIRVRAGAGEVGRRRFGIAHELGHWEQHEESQWLACSAADLRDYKKSPEEAEANTFAAELLMPEGVCRDLVAHYERRYGATPRFLEHQLAGDLLVSREAARWRLRGLGLTR